MNVALAALLFSTGGVAIKACSLSSWQVACYRSAIAAFTVLVLCPRLVSALRFRVWLVGAAFGSTMVLYALANKATTAANAIFLQDTAPLYVLLLAPWLLGERARRSDVVVMLVMAAGLVLVLFGNQPPSATAPDPWRGNLMAAAAGLSWALTVIGLRSLAGSGHADTTTSAFAAVFAGNALAALFALPRVAMGGDLGGLASIGPRDAGILLFLGVIQIAVAYVFLNRGIRGVAAFDAALILLLEPVFSTVWAALVFGERPGAWALTGALGIVLATVTKGYVDSRGKASHHAHHRPAT